MKLNDKNIKEFFTQETQNVQLNKVEKRAIREDLLSFIEGKTERNSDKMRHTNKPAANPLIWLKNMFLKPRPCSMVVTIMVSIMLATGIGTSFAAEFSLPGDFLYPVKINVNEEVRGWFAISEEDEANLALILAERRLDEAEKLALRGELTAELSNEIEERFAGHMTEAHDHLAILREESEDSEAVLGMSENLKNSLEAHANVLENISAKLEEQGEDITSVGLLMAEIKIQLNDERKTEKIHEEGNQKSESKSETETDIDIDEEDDEDEDNLEIDSESEVISEIKVKKDKK